MPSMKNISFLSIFFLLTIILTPLSGMAISTFVTIGTGGITGAYYPAGAAIARLVNKQKKNYGIRAIVESTPGSVFNIDALLDGSLDFAIVPSDRQFQAVNGLAEWSEKGARTALRSVFSIYPEAVTLVAAVDSGIQNIRDLKGKRVNIGTVGSGQQQNAIDALTAVGIDYRTDIDARTIKASDSAGMLQNNKIDAFFYTVGHPSDSIREVTSGLRRVIIVDITGIDEMLSKHPYYGKASIPVKLYRKVKNSKDAKTFDVRATLVTTVDTPAEIVYAITKEVFENLDEFKKRHSAFASLTKEKMLTRLSAPMHPGAIKYFKEAGLLP